MRFHQLIQNSRLYFTQLKQVCRTQIFTSTENHTSSLHSHFWVQLSARNPFLPPDKNRKFCDYCSTSSDRFSRSILLKGTLYIPLDTILPEKCAFIVCFSCTVWTKMRSVAGSLADGVLANAIVIPPRPPNRPML